MKSKMVMNETINEQDDEDGGEAEAIINMELGG
jgi:hypothetical protein